MKNNRVIIASIIAAIIIIPLIYFVSTYNSLVKNEEFVNEKWANIQTQLQRRADLIPNLVNTVEGYASHEQQIFDEIAKARSNLMKASSPQDAANADRELTNVLSRLLVIVENYPNLKANEQFINLQDELAGTENRIQNVRDEYNTSVQQYNRKIKSFPTLVFANMMGFEQKEYFEATAGADEVPKVDFGE